MATTFGPKADNLTLLSLEGYNIPSFYVVSANVKIHLDSKETQTRLKDEFTRWQKENGIASVAVRSSSTQEDSKNSSFAGQFTTILDVQTGDALINALTQVFSSKQSQAYSKETGEIHAIVQKFIEPDVSGVIFSVNPANGNNEFVINVASGRGTNVVEGKEAEQYFVSRMNPSKVDVKNDSGESNNYLSENQVNQLTTATLQIESLFGNPQDIEWAIRGGELYILQARPITRISHLRLWDSSNISESFPGVVLPLTFSIARKGYLLGYKAQAYSAGLSWYEIEAHNRTFDSMIGIFNGKMYTTC